ncbi:metallophosphoesterase family protein [Mesorhizobium silamurunense]|uniref:metallophosphoesterase family protein n=1 Tax=Mesorhizobium silamurunense TaxID=499528 RepID=UPI0028A74E89|nr:metallophosphoesterase [Mesorhizobium silamurunense]
MATPVIALRFRDTTPGIDTIQSHREIISTKGFVWWGWWKKTFEDEHLDALDTMNGPTIAYIVDRSTRRMFTATVEVWRRGLLDGDELAAVPDYYVDERDRIFGWFKLTEIQACEYLDEVANRFGDHTLVPLDGKAHQPDRVAATTRANRSTILHLSDLHFGPDYDFLLQGETPAIGNTKKTLTEALMDDLGRIGVQNDIGTILVTGDFTTKGDWSQATRSSILAEFVSLTQALGLERDQIVAVPGNHDIVRAMDPSSVDPAKLAVSNQATYEHELQYRIFCEELMGRSWRKTLNYVRRLQLGDVDVLIGVLNSCTIVQTEWSEYGYIGDSGIDALRELGDERIDRPTFKIMALHHHLLPVTSVATLSKKGITLSVDAPRILDAAEQAGVQLAVHGHEHMPRVVKYDNQSLAGAPQQPAIYVVSNGSTGVSPVRRPGNERNTYCVFRLSDKEMHLTMRELRADGKAGSFLFCGDLEISPIFPKAAA